MLSSFQKKWLNTSVRGSWKETNEGILVSGDLIIENLHELPINFNYVTGDVRVNSSNSKIISNITTLEGFPKSIEKNLHCTDLILSNLIGCPEYIGKDFICTNINISTLEGCAKFVGGDFVCSNNKLTDLIGGPSEINGSYICSKNNLTSMQGIPKLLKKSLICIGNPDLKTLFGIGKIKGTIQHDIKYNRHLNTIICMVAKEYVPNINNIFNFLKEHNFLDMLRNGPEELRCKIPSYILDQIDAGEFFEI